MAGRQLKELFRAYREGDELAFRRAAQEIIEEEEAKQHLVLARDLRRIIAGPTTVQVNETCQLPPPPTDREGEWPLAEPRIPSRYLSDLVLHHATAEALEGLSREVPRWEALDQRGIPRRQRVLFYGPPGTGKTSAAEGLAAEIGLPLLVVRLDAVVSSYLGETASNLRRVFDYVRSGSWLVLFDEFDALGKARDDPGEHGELRRVINAFLQMLDGFRGPSLLVAATNHEHLLDAALWRRFDEVVQFPLPTVQALRRLLRLRLPTATREGIDIDSCASALRGLPPAAVECAVWDARREALLDERERVGQRELRAAIARAQARPW